MTREIEDEQDVAARGGELARMGPAGALSRLDPQALLLEAVKAGGGIDVVERLMALAERVQTHQAREAFHAAMASFQAHVPEIKRNRWNDWTKSRYATLGQLIRETRPILAPLGLVVTFGGEVLDNPPRAVAWAIVTHALGHVETYGRVVIPIDTGSTNDRGNVKGANPAQRVGIAKQYARRYAYQDALGLNAEDDTDGDVGTGERPAAQVIDRATGEVRSGPPGAISENQIKRLYAIAKSKALGWTDEEIHKLLSEYGIGSVEAIPRERYEALVEEGIRKPEVLAQVRVKMAQDLGA